MNLLPNPRFRAGDEGWTIMSAYALGVTWLVTERGLEISAPSDAPRSPAGTVTILSPRVPVAGRVHRGATRAWRAGARLRTARTTTVELAAAVDLTPTPAGSPFSAPPRTRFETGPALTTCEVGRDLPDEAEAVGLRIDLPAGVDAVIEEAWLEADAEPDGLEALTVGLSPGTPHQGFDHGAAAAVGQHAEALLTVENEGLEQPGRLLVTVTDAYRETTWRLADSELPGERTATQRLRLPTDRPGSFVVRAEIQVDRGSRSAELRYLVTDDPTPPDPDPRQPWALTANLVNPERTAHLLQLLGVAHTRVYLGFSAWDLPAVADVDDPDVAAALASTLGLLGVAGGSVAGLAAHAHAQHPPTDDWPDFARAVAFVDGATVDHLRPEDRLLDPFRGLTVLVQTTAVRADDHGAKALEVLAAGLAGRGATWAAHNEPDLDGHDAGEFAVYQRFFGQAVRSGDPAAVVTGPVIADGWDGGHQGLRGWDWLVDWARAGGIEAVDTVSVQSHMLDEETATPEREDWEGMLTRLRRLVDGLGGAGKAIWVTEMGWRSQREALHGFGASEHGVHVTEPDQADLLVRTAVMSACAGVERFYAFHLHGMREFGEGSRFDWGLVTGQTAGPKPAFVALRELVRATAGLGRPRMLGTDRRVRAASFVADGRGAAVVWQWSGGPGLWRLDDPPPSVEIHDPMGVPHEGQDLRRPLLLRWGGPSEPVEAWLGSCLAPRYPLPS